MADVADDDLVEQILVRSDVKDLIRFKSVCKSWHSLITSPRFISLHLNHSYNKDRYNNNLEHRRISLEDLFSLDFNNYYIVGSSNGLVCIISEFAYYVLVCNPLTREVRNLKSPPSTGVTVIRGFGYDSSRDDYMVFVGARKDQNQTCVQVLSLKSDVWRVIGEVKYTFVTANGILWNGALHWIVRDENEKMLIISYDLSKGEFREIPQPDDTRYECPSRIHLGIIKECLCVCERVHYSFHEYYPIDIWLMKEYKVKESWELLPRDREMKRDIIHYLRTLKHENIFHIDKSWFSGILELDSAPRRYIGNPIFVQSLVSPHVNMEKTQLIKGGPSVLGPNG